MGKFVYIPSFSGGFFGNLLSKDFKIADKLPVRFYQSDYPEKHQHHAFLTTAGHYYRNIDMSKELGLDLDLNVNLVFGDSGGYQIASGAIKWDISIRDKIFNWLEHNSNIAVNLDIPPAMVYKEREKEALEISLSNFEFFEKNQSGKTKFLNVLQGLGYESRLNWYNKVKHFNFQGWAVGGTPGKYSRFFDTIYILLKHKEHLKASNYIIHFLGASTINEFSFYLQLQKSLNDVGSNVIITTDSSTPQRAVIWGTYYTEFNIKHGVFNSMNFPNMKHQSDIINNLTNFKWPVLCEFDNILADVYDWKEYLKETTGLGNQQYMAAMTLHNFAIFKEAIDKLEIVIEQDKYFQREIFDKTIFNLLQSIDELVKSDDIDKVYHKYKPLFMQYEAKQVKSQVKKHEYF